MSASGEENVRPGRALAHGNSDAGAREIRAARDHFALFHKLVEPGVSEDYEIGGLAISQPLRDAARWPVGDAQRVTAGALELRHQLRHRRFYRSADQRMDLGRSDVIGHHQHCYRDRGNEFEHGHPFFASRHADAVPFVEGGLYQRQEMAA